MSDKRKTISDKEEILLRVVRKMQKDAPWVLRVTEWKEITGPLMLIKERVLLDDALDMPIPENASASVLRDRARMYGQSLRTCLPIVKEVLSHVEDHQGIPLELHTLLNGKGLDFRGNLPLDVEAGAKLALLFKLQERIMDQSRVELIAWRVQRFSREEALYWLSRIMHYGEKANLWAQSGLRIMLGGQPKDPGIQEMLEQLRK